MYEFPVKIIKSGYSECSRSWTTLKSCIVPYFRIYYVAYGQGQVSIENRKFNLEQGSIYFIPGENSFIPTQEEYRWYVEELSELIENANTDECKVIIINNEDNYLNARTTPCFARFIYPTIGYDGWLYHCSQSSGSNFRSQALGNLATDNFWDLFYNYDSNNLEKQINSCTQKMESNNCRCDRKEHTVNAMINKNDFFKK